jgi:hypothetical protein
MLRKIQDTISSFLATKFKPVISYEKEFTESVGKTKVEIISLDKEENLDYNMLEKFLESINELVSNSQKAKVNLEIEFKDSILTCRSRNGVIALRTIQPKDCNNFEEVAFFDGDKPFPLKRYLYENVLTNADIVELEKTMIRLI